MHNYKKLFERPLPSSRSGAFYNTFSYPTKISPESIGVYIATMTKPGDTVLDVFSGSGSTGVAALLCEYPTDRMKELAEEFGVKPIWGKRNAVLSELGTYASFASKTITSKVKSSEFKQTVDDFVTRADEEIGDLYKTLDPEGNLGIIRYVIWSEVIVCPNCGHEMLYFDQGTKRNPVEFLKEIECPKCKKKHNVDDYSFATEKYQDPILNCSTVRKKRVPAWIYGTTNGKNWDRKATSQDKKTFGRIEHKLLEYRGTAKRIKWGELHRSGYHFGIDYLHQFYTERNFYVFHKLWDITNIYDDEIRDALRLLLLSYNSTHCTLMTRVVAKKNSKDFVLTGAQSGVLYVSKLPVEKNILLGLKRKAKPFIDAYKLLENCKGNVTVLNHSSEKLELANESIDFIFTDPPFGDFIPYAEVNQINELWLDAVTDRVSEVIISSSQNKGLEEYQVMLGNVFGEMNRVLRKDKKACVVFHAAKAKVWEAFATVINQNRFQIIETNILSKDQASFKQVVSDSSVQGDPIVLLQKDTKVTNGLKNDIANEVLLRVISNHKDETDKRRLYSLYIDECLEKGIKVALDAKEAYSFIQKEKKCEKKQ